MEKSETSGIFHSFHTTHLKSYMTDRARPLRAGLGTNVPLNLG